jgi:hypothetical protein
MFAPIYFVYFRRFVYCYFHGICLSSVLLALTTVVLSCDLVSQSRSFSVFVPLYSHFILI